MSSTIAQSVFLMNGFTPWIFAGLLGGWAWVVSHLDKDAEYYHLPRPWTNLALLATGILGFGVMLLIPYFILGLIVGLLPLAGGILAYAYYRNTQVSAEAVWTLSLDSFKAKLDQRQHAQAQKHATVTLLSQAEGALEVPSGDTPSARAHEVFSGVIDFAIPRGAEQIDMIVTTDKAALFARIDGVKYPQPQLEPQQALEVIDYLKQVAGLDVSDRRKKQVGTLRFDAAEHGRHEILLTTAGSTRGLTLSMALDVGAKQQMGMNEVGLLPAQAQQIQQLVAQPGKVILVAAMPGTGLTTLLYSFLQEHDPYTQSVVSLEDEDVFEIEGVSHNRMPGGIAATAFNEKLAAILRSDPNVLGLNRLPDVHTARLIAPYATEEMRFYVGLPVGGTFRALRTWIKAVDDPKLAGESLGGVVVQRLVRKLCTTCRSPYQPDPAVLKKMNLPADRVGQLFRASGQVMIKDKQMACPACQGIGYRGRVGVQEIMMLDDKGRQLIAEGDLDGLRTHLRRNKMLYLQEAGLAKVVEGITDIQEITRAMAEDKKKPKPSSAST